MKAHEAQYIIASYINEACNSDMTNDQRVALIGYLDLIIHRLRATAIHDIDQFYAEKDAE